MKRSLEIWQFTLPLCAVLMFTTGAYTTIHMVDGRYRVEVPINMKGLRIKTDVDKKECKPAEDKIQPQENQHSQE